MEPNDFGSGWERWRGKVDATMEDQGAALLSIWNWKTAHEADADAAKKEIFGRITVLETKIAGLAAIGGIIGGSAGAGTIALIQWALR